MCRENSNYIDKGKNKGKKQRVGKRVVTVRAESGRGIGWGWFLLSLGLEIVKRQKKACKRILLEKSPTGLTLINLFHKKKKTNSDEIEIIHK